MNWVSNNIILDDTTHYIVGSIIAMACFVLIPLITGLTNIHLISGITFLITFIFAYIGKEIIIDKIIRKGKADTRDCIATMLGSIFVIIFMEIMVLLNFVYL